MTGRLICIQGLTKDDSNIFQSVLFATLLCAGYSLTQTGKLSKIIFLNSKSWYCFLRTMRPYVHKVLHLFNKGYLCIKIFSLRTVILPTILQGTPSSMLPRISTLENLKIQTHYIYYYL